MALCNIPRGEDHPRATRSDATVRRARRMEQEGRSPAVISRELNVAYHTVYAWLYKGSRWSA